MKTNLGLKETVTQGLVAYRVWRWFVNLISCGLSWTYMWGQRGAYPYLSQGGGAKFPPTFKIYCY